MKDIFLSAIHSKNKVKIKFYSKKDERNIERKCAPLDFGPSKRTKEKDERFHVWDYEGEKGPHTSSLTIEQVLGITVLEERFDPRSIVTWTPDWIISRAW